MKIQALNDKKTKAMVWLTIRDINVLAECVAMMTKKSGTYGFEDMDEKAVARVNKKMKSLKKELLSQ